MLTVLKKYTLLVILLLLILMSSLLTACGSDSVTPTSVSSSNNTKVVGTSTTTTQAATTDAPLAIGPATAKPFFTPNVDLTSPSPASYDLAFDNVPGQLALDASVTGMAAPDPKDNEWEVKIMPDGTATYTKDPRDPARAVTATYYLNADKLNGLLQQLNGLGVLSWPDTTPPKGAPGLVRNLALYLKGQPKLITDLSGNTGDQLDKMLQLVQQTVQAAPLKGAP